MDYCNSLLLNLPATQTNRLQPVLNSASRADTKTPKFHHITPILKSLHWLKVNERIKYKVLSLTYKSLKTGQPSYLHSLLSSPSHRCTRSSFIANSGGKTSFFNIKLRNICSNECVHAYDFWRFLRLSWYIMIWSYRCLRFSHFIILAYYGTYILWIVIYDVIWCIQ